MVTDRQPLDGMLRTESDRFADPVEWPSYEDFVASGFKESTTHSQGVDVDESTANGSSAHHQSCALMVPPFTGKEPVSLSDRLHHLHRESHACLRLIESGQFEQVKALCDHEEVERDVFLQKYDRETGATEKEKWESFVRAYYGEAFLQLPSKILGEHREHLVSEWLERCDQLASVGEDELRWQALECLDCAIDLLQLWPSAQNHQRLIAAYVKRGEILYHFDAPECVSAAEASFDEAFRLDAEKVDSSRRDVRVEAFEAIIASDSKHKTRTGHRAIARVPLPAVKRGYRLRGQEEMLAPLILRSEPRVHRVAERIEIGEVDIPAN